ncbi:MAG TPA: GNAT family N-acetyltransferase [Acidimicrobiales bacterium]|nr:GNAT family N-acetyltransferase [Acidimicrobiales bacterium]
MPGPDAADDPDMVRPATAADAPRCAELCQAALAGLAGVRGGPLFTRREAGLVAKALLRPGGLARLLADDRRRVLVGLLEGHVVALGVGRVDEVGEASIGVIDGCYVEPAARQLGIGRALVEALVASFRAAGCRGVDVAALPGDRDTKNLLEGAGFKARVITMHRSLE